MPNGFTNVSPPKVSFWNDNKHSELVTLLNKDVPAMGEVKDKNRPMLEEWRKLSNAYYRCYNDGDAFANKLRHMAERHETEIWDSGKALEKMADLIFRKALLEKYLSMDGLNELSIEQIGVLIKQKLTHSKEESNA